MGQYMNQPDFITHSIKEVTPVAVGSLTAADSLDSSVIYIGGNTGTQDLEVIPAGAVGPSTITGFSSPGFVGSNGSQYVTGTYNVLGGSVGSGGLTVDIVANANGEITSIAVNISGLGYKNGDLITPDNGNKDAFFTILAEPGLPTQDQAVLFKNPPQGEWFPVPVDYVLSGNTKIGRASCRERV